MIKISKINKRCKWAHIPRHGKFHLFQCSLQDRFSEHRSYAMNQKVNKATGEHFSQKGHRVSDMRVSIIEKIFSSDAAVRKEREKYFITKMNTKYRGMNRIT